MSIGWATLMQDTEITNRGLQKKEKVAGGEGFEPSQSEPESDVLPLDDPPTLAKYSKSLVERQAWVKILNPLHSSPFKKIYGEK